MGRVQTAKCVLWGILGLGLAVVVHRLVFGLGATTNLTDAAPWGLWKGFGVIAGIALAAGGFVVTGVIHVFHLHKYHAMVRPAVITALMGYGSAATALLFDIGLPWRIWHPVIYWQIESPLFEVAWCVMLYLTVLILEFTPIVIEGWPQLSKVTAFMKKFSLPLVILGVMISTLHQSTLGTIFLITPFSLHPLWYSPIQNLLFIFSAAGLGAMVIVAEFVIVSWLYREPVNLPMLSSVARGASFALWAYLILRVGDLVFRGQIVHIADVSWESVVFVLELLFSTIIPCSLLASRRIRCSAPGLIGCAALIVLGFVFQRVAVSGLAMLRASNAGYFPSWSEFALSGGILSAAALFFMLAIEHLKIWTPGPLDPKTEPLPPSDSMSLDWLGQVPTAMPTRGSLALVLGAALAFGVLPFRSARSEGLEAVPTYAARGEQAHTLRIDGNRSGFSVDFDHGMHIEKNGGEAQSCKRCHHMNEPYDKNTGCYKCHSDMYLSTPIFSHGRHVALLGLNRSCGECHPGGSRCGETARACDECHVDELTLKVPGATIKVEGSLAVGYTEAMHGLCIACHEEAAKKENKPHHARCDACHKPEMEPVETADLVMRGGLTVSGRRPQYPRRLDAFRKPCGDDDSDDDE